MSCIEEITSNNSAFVFFIQDGIVRGGVKIKASLGRKLFVIYKGKIEYIEIPSKIYKTRETAQKGIK